MIRKKLLDQAVVIAVHQTVALIILQVHLDRRVVPVAVLLHDPVHHRAHPLVPVAEQIVFDPNTKHVAVVRVKLRIKIRINVKRRKMREKKMKKIKKMINVNQPAPHQTINQNHDHDQGIYVIINRQNTFNWEQLLLLKISKKNIE